jgi:hypothetical protein
MTNFFFLSFFLSFLLPLPYSTGYQPAGREGFFQEIRELVWLRGKSYISPGHVPHDMPE